MRARKMLLSSVLLGASGIAVAQDGSQLSALDGDSTDQQAFGVSRSQGESPDVYSSSIAIVGAQSSPLPESKESGSRLIEEVIVTSQKREENLRDVPLTVAAYSAQQLDAKAVFDAQDLPRITPGLTISNIVAFTTTYLRGVGSDAFILGDPVVVTYVDDVYFPFSAGQLQDFGSVERIEVLKGPQGTLFGRNALGGAIRVKTRDPALDRLEASIQTGYASDDTFKSRAYVSIPLGERLAISVSGLYNTGDNYLNGRHTARHVPLPRETSNAYRVKLYWQATDWLDLRLNVYQLHQDGASSFAVNTDPSLIGQLAAIQPQDPRHGVVSDEIFVNNDATTYFGQVGVKTAWFDLKLFGSSQDFVSLSSYDFDGSPRPLAGFVADPGFADTTTGELQILSNANSPFSEWLEWIFGAYLFDSRAGFEPAYLQAGGIDLQTGTLLGVPLPTGFANLLRNVIGTPPLPTSVALNFEGVLLTRSIAYYTQATAALTDILSLTVGARYQLEDRTVDKSTSGVRNADGSTIYLQRYSGHDNPRYRDTSRNFDPKVTLTFRPDSGWLGDKPLLYISYQTATTSSTFNTINIYDVPEHVDASEIAAYEAGIKMRLLDGLMDLNAAAFDYDIKKPQVQIVSLLAGGAVRFENAGSEHIRGFEFDTLIQLLPELTDNGLVLTLGGCYLDAIYTSFTNGSGFNQTTGMFESGSNDFTGNPVVRSPKFSGTAGLLQTFNFATGSIEIGVNYYYNSGYTFLAQNTPNASQRAYDTLGAQLSYLYQPWKLRISVFGTNVLNEDYNYSRFVTDFGTNDVPAPRASYGLRVNLDY